MCRLFSGRRRPATGWDAISTLASAEERLRNGREVAFGRRAGVLYMPADVPILNNIESEMRRVLYHGPDPKRTALRIEDDRHGGRWVVLDDGNFADLVASAYRVGAEMATQGAADQLKAAVFQGYYLGASHDDALQGRTGMYWIYRYERKAGYPFVPAGDAEGERDRPMEMQIARVMQQHGVAVEESLEDWYGLWGLPL